MGEAKREKITSYKDPWMYGKRKKTNGTKREVIENEKKKFI